MLEYIAKMMGIKLYTPLDEARDEALKKGISSEFTKILVYFYKEAKKESERKEALKKRMNKNREYMIYWKAKGFNWMEEQCQKN